MRRKIFFTSIASLSPLGLLLFPLVFNSADPSDPTDATGLINSTTSPVSAIPTLTSAVTYSAWSSNTTLNNQWGFTHNNTGTPNTNTGVISENTYLPVTPLSSPTKIKVTSAPANTSSTEFTFAAKADTSIPAGSYNNTITFSAVANFASGNDTNKTIYDITTMQEMTSTICDNTTTPLNTAITPTATYSTSTNLVPETELTDIRDGNVYTIRKLADGNCWMVENLKLKGGTTITSELSDIQDEYILPVSNMNGFVEEAEYMFDNTNGTNGFDGASRKEENERYRLCLYKDQTQTQEEKSYS